VAQGIGPEFKPQYGKKQKHKWRTFGKVVWIMGVEQGENAWPKGYNIESTKKQVL
jgi:hypothetical protein